MCASAPKPCSSWPSPTRADGLAGKELAAYPGGSAMPWPSRSRTWTRPPAHLADTGVGVLDRDDTTIMADPDDTFGAPFRFTTWRVPGDPRD